MGKYLNQPIADLAAELSAGPARLRKGYLDAAEAMLYIVDPAGEYPYDFIVFRLTAYRPARNTPAEPISGTTLRDDLLQLMLDVSRSFDLRGEDYRERVYDTPSLARQFHVATKTIQRWRSSGLPARWMVFPQGKPRIGYPDSTIQRFLHQRQDQVARSARFSRMPSAERKDILRRARRMARFTNCSLSEVAKRLAVRTGRAPETVRTAIRKHDIHNANDPIFPSLSAPLDQQQKQIVYRCFLNGVSVPTLAERYHRTRGSIYRIVNEVRAMQLTQRPISYVHNPLFDLPNADEMILGDLQQAPHSGGDHSRPHHAPAGTPAYFKELYDVPLLDAKAEQGLFRQYNYLKCKADRLRQQIDANRILANGLKQIESLLLQANVVKNYIIRANLRLVVSIAKKHVTADQTLFELISDGNVSLMRAVEKFDFARGFRFSTYGSWAIMRNFARTLPRERFLLDRFSTGQDEIIDIAGSLRSYDPNESNIPELRESIDSMLAKLSPRERTILIDHYGLDDEGQPKTFDQLGRRLGISKERVRQIELRALSKLREQSGAAGAEHSSTPSV